MSHYFHVSHGLRGCYMPDGESYIAKVDSRRELKTVIEYECEMIATEHTQGFSKKNIARFAAMVWRGAQHGLPDCLPCRERGQSGYPYGIMVSRATRKEFVAQKEND